MTLAMSFWNKSWWHCAMFLQFFHVTHIYVTLTCVMKTTQNINADVAALPRPGFSSHSDDLKSRLQFSSMTDGGVRKPKWVRGDGDRGERERHATCWLSNLVPYKYGWCWFARHLHPWTMVSFLRGIYIVRVNMIFDRPIQEALRHSFTADYVTNMQMQTCLAKWCIPTRMHESWWNLENNKRRS